MEIDTQYLYLLLAPTKDDFLSLLWGNKLRFQDDKSFMIHDKELNIIARGEWEQDGNKLFITPDRKEKIEYEIFDDKEHFLTLIRGENIIRFCTPI